VLSPWFIFGSPVGRAALRAAKEGRLPPDVKLKDIGDFLVSLHSSGGNMLGVLHSMGWVHTPEGPLVRAACHLTSSSRTSATSSCRCTPPAATCSACYTPWGGYTRQRGRCFQAVLQKELKSIYLPRGSMGTETLNKGLQ
jgi:hypothetical protein